MSKYNDVMALKTPTMQDLDEILDPEMKKYFAICQEKLGIIPNVLMAYASRPNKLRHFVSFYNEIMLGPSGLTKLEREMIALVVSSTNHCYYCVVAHGQAVRHMSDEPALAEMLVTNYRVASLSVRVTSMLDFVQKLTESPHLISDSDRQALRDNGFTDEDIFDIADTAGFFNMSNRVASGLDIRPNSEYHQRSW
jgi:uncharacterized peroxidase-related enzyme